MKRKTLIILGLVMAVALLFIVAGCAAGDLDEPVFAPSFYPNANNTGNVGSSVDAWQNMYSYNYFTWSGSAWVLVGGGGGMIPLTSAHLYVGNVLNVATDVAATGDLTVDNTGLFTITGIQGHGITLPMSSGYLYYNTGTTSWSFGAGGSGMVNPMTTLGDIIYENSTPAADRLAGDTSNTDKFLRSLSIAGVAQAPSWESVTKTDVGLSAVENTALSTWAGTSNITTLGTIVTGTWHGTAIDDSYISSAATWNGKQAGSANLTSLAGLSYASTSFVKMTSANTFTLDTNTYLTSVTAHNLLSATHGDTVTTSAVLGDIIYANATPAWQALSGNTTTTKEFLSQTGAGGGVSAAPSWQSVTKADVGLSAVENTALSTWAGTSNIITLGTVTTGVWHGTAVDPQYGGTGVVNDATNTLTFTGKYSLGITLSNNTSVTLPTSGTLMNTTDNAASATYASAATIVNDTTNATMYPVWVTANTGNLALKVTSGDLTYNPSTGNLTATTFTGALSGNATTATSAGSVTGLSVTAGKTLTVTDSATIATNAITLGGGEIITFTAGNNLTLATTGATSVTLPTSGTLVNTSVDTLSSLASIGTITTGVWHGTAIGEIYGGTNQTSYALGDTLYSSATNTLAKLAGNTTTTKKYLTQTGDGANSAAPAWGTIAAGDLPIVTPAKGGTGVANGTNNTITFTGNYTFGLTLTNNTSVTFPTSGTLSTLAGAETLTNKTLTTPVVQVSLTAGENIAAYQACYIKSDGKVYLAKANSSTTMPAMLIAQVAVNINDAGNFMGYGYITNAGWAFTAGQTLYVSQTTGGLVTATAPNASGNQVQVVGIAITATQMCWYPSPLVMELQ